MALRCQICGDKLGLGNKIKVRDGMVCAYCGRYSTDYALVSIDALRKCGEENNRRYNLFTKTNELGGSLLQEAVAIDDTHKLFYIGKEKKMKREPVVYAFDEVESYQFQTAGEKVVTKSKGGIGRAVVGGALLGPAGAIVGASTSKKETKTVGGSTFLNIKLQTLAGGDYAFVDNPPLELPSFLDHCIEEREKANKKPVIESVVSPADELLKWKALLDQDVISPEQFEAKKKQLLGL